MIFGLLPKMESFFPLYFTLFFSLSLLSAQLLSSYYFFNICVVHKGITQEPEINYSVHRPNQSSLICNSCHLKKKSIVFKSDRHNYARK